MKRTNIILVLLGLSIGSSVHAQVDPMMSQYFNNRYLANPAMAGFHEGLTINGIYRQLMSGFPEAPVTQSLNGEYGLKQIGVGLNLLNETLGSMRETRGVATFSYFLPLGKNEERLRFGLSLGAMSQSLNQGKINTQNNSDQSIGNYNNRATYFDGDFGLAYTDKKFRIQAAMPNLRHSFKRDYATQSNVSIFYLAASYRIQIASDTASSVVSSIEPLIAARKFSHVNVVGDIGVQANILKGQAFFSAMYHSTGSASIGLGMNFKKMFMIGGVYTTSTREVGSYSNGNFEINLRYALWK